MAATAINSRNIEEKNLALLRNRDPGLARLISSLGSSPEHRLVPSREGTPTLIAISPEGREVSLHSRYNPLEEASRLVKTISTRSSLNFLVLGFGLGFHVAELIRNIPPSARVLVVESQPHFIRLALQLPHMQEILEFPRIKLITGTDIKTNLLAESFEEWSDTFTLNGFTPIRFTPVTRHGEDFYTRVESELAESIRQTQVAHNTRRALSRLLYRNSLENLETVIRTPGVSRLQDSAQGRAALVVGAGPSLDKNIHLIRGAGDRALVIAVSTAFKPLVEAGIDPDFVVAIDPKIISFSAFSNTRIPASTRLVFDPAIPPGIAELFAGKRYVTDSPLFLGPFLATVLPPKGSLGTSSSVAHTALFLARHLGCKPIVLAGQDLAFSGTRSHCSGSYHLDQQLLNAANNVTTGKLRQSQRAHSTGALQISRDLFGQTVTTSSALDSFRFPYEQEEAQAPRAINATEGGLSLKGFEEATLRETLASFPPMPASKTSAVRDEPLAPETERKIQALLEERVRKFETLSEKLKSWLSRPVPATQADLTQRNAESERLLQDAVDDADGIRLLQEYLYSEFLDWNRENARIELEPDAVRQAEMKFERDLKLFGGVVEAIDCLDKSFSRFY
ncbi:MAG: DUF115 domain-containing protein [Nitrospina sp.]|nr:DUF115 domain-containing protein [Nitrospina sp.]